MTKFYPAAVGDTVACGRCNRKEWLSAAAFPRKPEAATAGRDKIDNEEADEVIDAIAKTVAELTSQQDGFISQQLIEQLMRQIMHCDAEFRREVATSAIGPRATH